MRLPLSIALIFCLFAAKAQIISVKGGFALPSGHYANTVSLQDDGFATSGNFVGLELSYPAYKRISICMEMGFSGQGVESKKLQEALQASHLSIKQNFRASYALAGAGVSWKKKSFDLGLRVMVGFMGLSTPAYTASYEYPSNTGTVYTDAETASGAAIGWGAQLGYYLTPQFRLSLDIFDISSSLNIKRSYASSNQQYTELDYHVYQAGLGIGYAF